MNKGCGIKETIKPKKVIQKATDLAQQQRNNKEK